jgi:hypothetical protein
LIVSPSVDGSGGAVVDASPLEIIWLFENELFFELESLWDELQSHGSWNN